MTIARKTPLQMMHQAVALHQQGFLSEAEELYHAILAASPRNVDALRLLGGLYMQMNKPKDAGACFQKALRFTPITRKY